MRYSLIIPVAPLRKIEALDSIKLLNYQQDEIETITEEGTNPSKNRNRGIKRSKGDIILLLDDEVHFHKDLLKKADDFFKECPQYDILGGPQLTPQTDNFFAKLSGIALASIFGTFKISNRYKKGAVNFNATEFDITSANCFIKKGVFEKIGYFHPFLYPAEEREFFSRAQVAGFKIAKSPEVCVYHKRRSTLSALAKQIYGYGVTRPQKEVIIREKLHIELEFICVALFTIYITLLPLSVILYKPFIIPFLFYLFFILIGGLAESIVNKNIACVFALPPLFFVIHYFYGLGLISGFIKSIFLYKNKKRKQLIPTD